MALPKQVQKQVDEAERIAAEIEKAQEQTPDEETPPEESPVSLVEDTPPAEEPPAEDPPAEEPPAPPASEDPNWEQRYNTLQGKYDSETANMRAQLASMSTQMESMQTAMEAMSAPKEDAPAEQSPAITSEEIDEYGADMLDVVSRQSVAAVKPLIDKLTQRVEELTTSVGGVQKVAADTERDRMLATLTEQVPNWKEINVSDGYLDWLKQVDPFAGRYRQEMLTEAYQSNNAQRVVAFFEGYLKEQTAVQTDSASTNVAPPTPDAKAGGVDLESMVSPGGAQEAQPTVSAQGNEAETIFTNADVAKFYADVQKGRYKGRDDEKLAMEKSIVKAANEGRIR